jgi:hypothetical protein
MTTFRNATLLLCVLAWAGSAAMTRIYDTNVVRIDGTRATGTIFAACQKMATDGKTIVTSTVSIPLVNGLVDKTLFAQDTAVPTGTSCHVTYQFSDRTADQEDWIIPTSTAPVTIRDIRVTKLPAPSFAVPFENLAIRSGIANGTYCVQATRGSPPSLVACSGGSASGINAAATWAQIEAGAAGPGSTTPTMTWAQIEAQ